VPDAAIVATLGVLAASVLRGFTGFGFGLAAVPLLSLALPPAKVVPFVVVLQAVVGLAGLPSAWHLTDWRAVRALSPGLVAGVPLGLLILIRVPANPVRLLIGLMIAGSVLLLWRGVRLPENPSKWATVLVGFVSGVMSGIASVGGPPIVLYFLALAHPAAVIRASCVVYFMLSAFVSLAMMVSRGLIDREIAHWVLLSIPVLTGGTWLGAWGFRHAQPHHHRQTAIAVLSLLSAVLIGRALFPGTPG
jgi:uncharacterized membrane protein YfcA